MNQLLSYIISMFFIYSNLISTSDTICLSPGAFGRLRGLKKGKNVKRNHRVWAVFVEEVVIYCYVLHILFLIVEYSFDLMNISNMSIYILYIYIYFLPLSLSWSFPSHENPKSSKLSSQCSLRSKCPPPHSSTPRLPQNKPPLNMSRRQKGTAIPEASFKAHHGHSF